MPNIVRRTIKRPAQAGKPHIWKKPASKPNLGRVNDLNSLRRVAESFAGGKLKKAGKAYIVHNGGKLSGTKGYRTGKQLEVCQHIDFDKDDFGFAYHILSGLVDPDDADDNSDFEDDPRIAISIEEGGEVKIHSAYKDKKSAEHAAKHWKPPRGISAVSAVNIYLCSHEAALPSKLYVVKGSVVGEGVGMYLFGAFSMKPVAEAHAAKALCTLPELYDGRGGLEPEEMGDVSEVMLQNGRTFQISIYRNYSDMVTRVTSEQVRVQ